MKQIEVVTAQDLAQLYNKSPSWGYGVIKKLNSELEDQGFYTVAGVVPRKYFLKRFGLEDGETKDKSNDHTRINV